MRIAILAGAIALSACATPDVPLSGPASAQIAQFDAKLQRGEALVSEIGAMYARDRLLREAIIAGFRDITTAGAREAYIEGTRRHFDRIDGENTGRLRQIFSEMTWRDLRDISPSAAEQSFSLISHSDDLDLKRQMAAQFEPLVREGIVQADRYANLVDDIALGEGNPPVYGMNFECHHGVYQPRPVIDPENLNARRAAIGLNSIEEYAAESRALYGECPADYSGN
ncbi:MAG: DUF6624 domain-containing protein [Terricaulis sp.]